MRHGHSLAISAPQKRKLPSFSEVDKEGVQGESAEAAEPTKRRLIDLADINPLQSNSSHWNEECSGLLNPPPFPDASLPTESNSKPSSGERPPEASPSAREASDPAMRSGSPTMHAARQRYLVTVEYIGSSFFGFQKQKSVRTVQGVLEDAFHNFLNHPVEIVGSSRTDAGVNATGNTFHVDIERTSKRKPNSTLEPFGSDVVKKAVNHFLSRDGSNVAISKVRIVPESLHARFSAIERTYHYRIICGKCAPSIFNKNFFWHVNHVNELDMKAMLQACKLLEGSHDFSSFRASGCQSNSPIKTLTELSVVESNNIFIFPSLKERQIEKDKYLMQLNFDKIDNHNLSNDNGYYSNNGNTKNDSYGSGDDYADDEQENENKFRCYIITARARSFLYHQVRLMVGFLKTVGCGAIQANEVHSILDAKSTQVLPPMAPANALFLHQVKYDFNNNQNLISQNTNGYDDADDGN